MKFESESLEDNEASKIIKNYTKPEPISWKMIIKDSVLNICVGIEKIVCVGPEFQVLNLRSVSQLILACIKTAA